MKTQYLVGEPTNKFIRLLDGHFLIGTSKSFEEAKTVIERLNNKKFKIFKLIEVK